MTIQKSLKRTRPDTYECRAGLKITEVRQDGEGGAVIVRGHAAVFGEETELDSYAGTFREKIAPGAFADSIKNKNDVVLNVDHTGLPLARTTSGTLELEEDEVGLAVRAELDPNDPDVQRVLPKMKRGDLTKMSFAFMDADDVWDKSDEDLPPLRTLTRLDIFDVSMVTWPAYEGTDVGVAARSLERLNEEDAKQDTEDQYRIRKAKARAKMLRVYGRESV